MLFDAAKLLQLFEIYKSFLYFFKKILIISIFILRLCMFVIAPSKKACTFIFMNKIKQRATPY